MRGRRRSEKEKRVAPILKKLILKIATLLKVFFNSASLHLKQCSINNPSFKVYDSLHRRQELIVSYLILLLPMPEVNYWIYACPLIIRLLDSEFICLSRTSSLFDK